MKDMFKIMKFKKLFIVSLIGIILVLPFSVLGATAWVETQPAGDIDIFWTDIASDNDGSNLIVSIYNGRLYISSDSGSTWVETQPAGDINCDWKSIASDSDGSNLIAAARDSTLFPLFFGRLYISSDGGSTWVETQPAGDVDLSWNSVASDSDGSNLIAGIIIGRLYISSDGGSTWVETQPAGDIDKKWISVASDSDGSNLIVAVNNGRLYIGTPPPLAFNILPIGTDFPVSILAHVGELVVDLKLLLASIIGLPLGFWAIRKTILLVKAR